MSCHAAQELDLLGYGDSVIHRLDGRAKLLGAMVYVICVASFPKYAVADLIPFSVFPLVLGVLGGVPGHLILRLLCLAAPLAVLVGLFNPLLDTAPAVQIGTLTLGAGWLSFLSIVLRFALSLSMVLVVVATTSLPGLLHGLLQLGVPRPFVTQLQFLYRYLFLLVEEGQHLSRARQLRNPTRRHVSLGVLPKLLSALLWHTWERAEKVFLCMKVRGFQGDFPLSQSRRFRINDGLFLGAMALLCVLLRSLPLVQWLGQFILEKTT
ncbi:MAG TPA: cobalt ECF transporter T component CbiQ [Verrucomicrobia bacterium]|nr:MAG: cobalt ECF transporter T component CbiQ [Lentisphaerae bacterium GWF2_57_35]HBA82785.1 cobalt ECF transporter T component CbiQ [Verrucomicrobiota bacterium]